MSFTNGYALVIGSSKFQQASMGRSNVPVAARDAEAVSAVLQDEKRCGYPKNQVTLLTEEKATRVAILDAIDNLASHLKEENTLFLFFVGHGIYGTDGNYYLTTFDTQFQRANGIQVVADTGVSENDLIERLRKVKAKRILVILNSCHSGQVSPENFGGDNDDLNSETPPAKLADALLSTGEGRIIITACRPDQKSWIGPGKLSIFSGALVNGLSGEAPKTRGYISAFALYEYLYFETKEAAGELGHEQDSELTVIKGVGPFVVALYHGIGGNLGDMEDLPADLPAGTATRAISREKSQRSYNQYQYNATVNGGGAIAQGNGAKAVGAGGVMIDGNVSGNIVIGNNNKVSNNRMSGDASTDAPHPGKSSNN